MRRLTLLFVAGCAQLLGLDSTTFQPQDAGTDAPSVCDGIPATCSIAGSGLAPICGRILGTGSQAGVPLRVAAPTGAACTGTEGPCALTVQIATMSDFFNGGSSTPATIDDCGRFTGTVAGDATDVAVTLAGSTVANSASLINGLAGDGGSAQTDLFAITPDTESAWSAQENGADMSTGFLLRFTGSNGDLITNVGVTNDNAAVYSNAPGTEPWAAYFTDQFGTFGTGSASGPAGTAFGVPPTGTIRLEGFRTGHARCGRDGIQLVSGFVIFVLEVGC